MKIEFDQRKNEKNIAERRLDFRDAAHVFDGPEFTIEDDRKDYGESRWITFGSLAGIHVVVVWTKRMRAGEPVRRIVSMRRANGREIKAYLEQLEGGREDTGDS